MNKVTKGTLAAAAAGALLLGGAGTYAVWTDSASLNAGNVSTGVLTLDAVSTQGWSYDGGDTIVGDDPSTEGAIETATPDIVPGDTLTAVYNVDVVAEGDNIKGSLSLAGIDQATLPAGTTVSIVADGAGAGLGVNGADLTFTEAATYDFNVTVTVDFPVDSEAGQNGTIDLAGAELVLTQTAS
ncbi:alternate-type signal peptide domain-containing protein [Arthrobacter sp.]|uniref:alternate-type signal peptide domain-containing protein n=1 Tax=Arthrobacter sp. TaxID=1667 RepID=UPI0028114BF5|nr:alternate-type signal peptide domain-containing protein [Arthrobacter sp.]